MSNGVITCETCKLYGHDGIYSADRFKRCPYCLMRSWKESPVAIFEGFKILTKEAQDKLIEESK